MAKLGINFRGTSGYVTDGTGETYATVGSNDVYPTTRGGLTFGQTSATDFATVDRVAGNDRRLAGIMYTATAGKQFRIDLPDGAGTYDFWCAVGDGSDQGAYAMLVKDGSTTLLTVSGTTAASNQFIDAGNTVRTNTDWVSTPVSASLVFSGSYMILESNSTAMRVTHVALEQTAGGGGSAIGAAAHYYSTMMRSA